MCVNFKRILAIFLYLREFLLNWPYKNWVNKFAEQSYNQFLCFEKHQYSFEIFEEWFQRRFFSLFYYLVFVLRDFLTNWYVIQSLLFLSIPNLTLIELYYVFKKRQTSEGNQKVNVMPEIRSRSKLSSFFIIFVCLCIFLINFYKVCIWKICSFRSRLQTEIKSDVSDDCAYMSPCYLKKRFEAFLKTSKLKFWINW